MTHLTPKEMLDAVDWALRETWRQINSDRTPPTQEAPRPKRLSEDTEGKPPGRRGQD